MGERLEAKARAGDVGGQVPIVDPAFGGTRKRRPGGWAIGCSYTPTTACSTRCRATCRGRCAGACSDRLMRLAVLSAALWSCHSLEHDDYARLWEELWTGSKWAIALGASVAQRNCPATTERCETPAESAKDRSLLGSANRATIGAALAIFLLAPWAGHNAFSG